MLKIRSDEPELMDDPKVDKKLLQKNLEELDVLNRYFGGNSVTLHGVRKLIDRSGIYNITDLGCGSGETLRYIARWARRNKYKLKLVGIDMNVHAIQHLKRNSVGFPEISGMLTDYSEYMHSVSNVDVYICSLFCHHLNDEQLRDLFRHLKKARTGFVINDLQRSWLAYYSAWAFTRLFNGTMLSKNDGPLSVLKAFTRKELEHLLRDAGIEHYTIEWKWAFRYRIVVKTSVYRK